MIPALVVTEVGYLLERELGPSAEATFYRSLADGDLVVEPVEPSDWYRIAELIEAYEDLPLGGVDASVIAAAERLGVTTVATLDHRHFEIVKPAHVVRFELVPD